jgi:tetratricopeptide (TPR) repeat protein
MTDVSNHAPTSVQASVCLAKALSLASLGRHDEALVLFDLAVKHDPHSSTAWVCRGRALTGVGRIEEALSCFDTAIAQQPHEIDAWVEKGRVLAHLGRRHEALICFDEVLNVHPWHVHALYERGVALFFSGQYREAAQSLAEVHRIAPGRSVEVALNLCLDRSARSASSSSGIRSHLSTIRIEEPKQDPPLRDDKWRIT